EGHCCPRGLRHLLRRQHQHESVQRYSSRGCAVRTPLRCAERYVASASPTPRQQRVSCRTGRLRSSAQRESPGGIPLCTESLSHSRRLPVVLQCSTKVVAVLGRRGRLRRFPHHPPVPIRG